MGHVQDVTPPGDALSGILHAVNVRSSVFCVSQLGSPWGFRVDTSPAAKFHLVLRGAALLTVEDGDRQSVPLSAGDLVLLPHGTGHVMQDAPGSRVRRLDRILVDHPVDAAARMTYGGRGPTTSLLCGGFDAGVLPVDVAGLLPASLVLDGGSTAIGRWIRPLFELLRDEHTDGAPGSAAVLSKIADVFLTDVLRQFLAGTERLLTSPSAAAAGDPEISEALRALRAQPALPWTVAALARHVGMSRTAFASRFRYLVGDSPIAYLANVRLSRGAGLLSSTRGSVAQIARSVGYDNEASFSKAFKRAYGRSPGAFRAERPLHSDAAVATASLLG